MNFPCSVDTASNDSPDRAAGPVALAKTPKLRKIATSLGTLEFFEGVPTRGTVRKVYDNLDLIHAVDAFIRSFSSVSQYRLCEAQQALEGKAEPPGKFQRLTMLTQGKALLRMSRYRAFSFVNLERHGPVVIELPAGTLGMVKDMWFHIVGELGMANVQADASAKYLLLPPYYEGDVLPGYVAIRPRTHQVCLLIRPARAMSGAANAVPPGLKVYPLLAPERGREAADLNHKSLRPIMEIAPDDRHFFEDLHRLVQEQPLRSLDGEKRSLLASIGIVKGKPFRPSMRMRQILRDATAIGSAAVRAMRTQQAPSASATAARGPVGETFIRKSRRRSSVARPQHLETMPQA